MPDLCDVAGRLASLARSRPAVPLLYIEFANAEGTKTASARKLQAQHKQAIAAALKASLGTVLRKEDLAAAGTGAQWFIALLIARARRRKALIADADLGVAAQRLRRTVERALAAMRGRVGRATTVRQEGHAVRCGWTVLELDGQSPLAALRQAVRGAAVVSRVEERRATVLEFNDDGSGQRIFADGLRNSVGLAVNPKTGTIWTTDNGRDWLGDNTPPDEINDMGTNGGDFGWPYCYGNRVTDTSQTRPGDERCQATIPPKVEIQAHSAPLGLAFYSGTMFPPDYRGDLFVALHGSWNRSVPAGYKVVRIKLNDQGQPQGPPQDFITGWIRPGETRTGVWMGRPVGIVVGPEGAMYVSDDASGVIYRVTWEK